MPKPIVNVDELTFSPRHPDFSPEGKDQFEVQTAPVAGLIGACRLGYNVTMIPAGKAAYPFHAHRTNEEMFFVLQGTGEVRFGSRTYPIRAGDFIACPPGGAEVAHQIRNTGDGDLRFLAVSTLLSPEINEYPDSGKFGVYADLPSDDDGKVEYFSFQGRRDMNLDYWDGEGEE